MVYSIAVTGGFFRDTEEVNARIFPTRIAIEQSSSHAQALKFSYQHFLLCTVNRCALLILEVTLGLLLFLRALVVVKPSSHVALRRKIGSANAHWATPLFSGCLSTLLKRERFGYESLTNFFSTTLYCTIVP